MSDAEIPPLPSLEERLATIEVRINEVREEYLSLEPVPSNSKVRGLLKSKMNGLMENKTLLLEMLAERHPTPAQSPISQTSQTNVSLFPPSTPMNIPSNLPLFEGSSELSIRNPRQFGEQKKCLIILYKGMHKQASRILKNVLFPIRLGLH